MMSPLTRRQMIACLLAAPSSLSRFYAEKYANRQGELVWQSTLPPKSYVGGVAPFQDGSIAMQTLRISDDVDYVEFVLWRIGANCREVWSKPLLPGDATALAAASRRFGTSGGYLWGPGDGLMRSAALVRAMDRYPLTPELLVTTRTSAGGEGILCGDALLGIWRVSGAGEPLWHDFPDQPLGLSVITAMDAAADGGVLVGGAGLPTGPACEVAMVTSTDHDGVPSWTWRFAASSWITFAVRVLALEDGAAAALIASAAANRNLSGLPNSPCRGDEPYPQWLAWLRPDGSLMRLEALETEGVPVALTRFPTGEVLTVGSRRFADTALFRIYAAHDGTLLNQFRVDPKRDLGAEPGLSFWNVYSVGVDAGDLVLMITWYCLPHGERCPPMIHALATVSIDGTVRLRAFDVGRYGWPFALTAGTPHMLTKFGLSPTEIRRTPLP